MGWNVDVDLGVIEYDPERAVAVRSTSGLLPFTARWSFEEEGSGTKFRYFDRAEEWYVQHLRDVQAEYALGLEGAKRAAGEGGGGLGCDRRIHEHRVRSKLHRDGSV